MTTIRALHSKVPDAEKFQRRRHVAHKDLAGFWVEPIFRKPVKVLLKKFGGETGHELMDGIVSELFLDNLVDDLVIQLPQFAHPRYSSE